ncbi:MAG: nascent polypeptide-associated complex protein [Candidatus Nanoarchaeia archaeon]|nr:nascent polypeptide-associated complex protein [Candidatus Nanoarchaeia archaeon]
MMPGMDPRMVKMAMKKLGIKQDEIGASRVIIETTDNKKIIIENPSVTKVDMAGQVSFQISGEIVQESAFNEEDVEMIMEQTKASKEKVKSLLEKNNGDIAKTILDLKK